MSEETSIAKLKAERDHWRSIADRMGEALEAWAIESQDEPDAALIVETNGLLAELRRVKVSLENPVEKRYDICE